MPSLAAAMMRWICSVGNTVEPSSVKVLASGCFSLTVIWSPVRSAMPSTGLESPSFIRAVDLEAIALARAVLPRGRAQVAQRHLALADFELGDLAEFGGVALAGVAGEIVEDAPARAVDRARCRATSPGSVRRAPDAAGTARRPRLAPDCRRARQPRAQRAKSARVEPWCVPWDEEDSATLMTGPLRRNWGLHHGNVRNSPD